MLLKSIIVPFATGLALFLFGMQVMQIGLANLTGDRLKIWLARFTKTPIHGLFSGLLCTLLVQSSSAVTVATVGLTSARMLSFPQTIGIILGANIGTCITGELIALQIDKLAVPLLFIGSLLWLLPAHAVRCVGLAMVGFSCVFIGIDAMSYIAQPLKEMGMIQNTLALSDGPLKGLLIGTAVTALIQSSSATVGILMSLAESSLLPMPAAAAIILGANIGTCFTAALAAVGASKTGQQAALAHILFNLFGALLFLPLIPNMLDWVAGMSADPPTQVARFQTLFNLISALMWLPFAHPYARLIERIIPAKRP
jgi:phosphate:Na+ symporter